MLANRYAALIHNEFCMAEFQFKFRWRKIIRFYRERGEKGLLVLWPFFARPY